ncbi:glutamine amidotransferase subunit PdxT [Corynebacterium diphtheriae]|uniref:pyridoxal 5'-phosphate synthase glutaminase subunit PdxT n=1 Tax=Corynebacterium diphtheriae TaxID=1717 RepID=UPI000925B466|nr:pyridoxal 5'-phosphate synthase glutaminase subunit PdxT [Corynebacterium diphtheriae]MBG9247244.1 pyridoxal 5'-phosphate synthase glutaminase subunit PdxT [Corynebacterium diphtheriae bv. mitis]OJH92919.1 glutamine amidotransferase subunit PdxT [Corynebacterium diphtheriae]CAB0831776.1 pyridoxal 5'-phosphate synthase glutaminase subunit PdxT [Corynebacterium diphtheriae]CAB0889274.1 pyridoxal 5'-phosphate synthase glutaminase subunit PdxT [Corynebacterium diphtheriae]
MVIGVLTLQGGFAEHIAILESLGVEHRRVRVPNDLLGLDGLIIPGGESTVMDKLARAFDLAEPLRAAINNGLPVFATCAGLIYLGTVENPAKGQQTLGCLDVVVRRNAFGRQVDSFDAVVDVEGIDANVAFIRAPEVISCGVGVTVTARVGDHVVGVRQGKIHAYAFHPESAGEVRLHQAWIDSI